MRSQQITVFIPSDGSIVTNVPCDTSGWNSMSTTTIKLESPEVFKTMEANYEKKLRRDKLSAKGKSIYGPQR